MKREMVKLAGLVIDQYDDSGFIESIQAKLLFGRELIAPEDIHKLASGDFATRVQGRSGTYGKYPIYNGLATRISCEYFSKTASQLPVAYQKEAADNLAAACVRYGITAPEAVILAQTANQVPVKALMALDKEASAAVLTAKVLREFGNMEPRDRMELAFELSKVAEVTDRRVYDYIPKTSPGPYYKEAVRARRELLKQASYMDREQFELMLADAESKTLLEQADDLAAFDKRAGFDKRYKDGFTDPYKAAFGGHRSLEDIYQIEKNRAQDAPVFAADGSFLDKVASVDMSVEDHIHALKANYAKGTKAFEIEKRAAPPGTWGVSYHKAREIYFG